jgi:hypothetical protein
MLKLLLVVAIALILATAFRRGSRKQLENESAE